MAARALDLASRPWHAVRHAPSRLAGALPRSGRAAPGAVLAALGVAAALAGMAWYVRSRSEHADALRPPRGRFIDVAGVRLHCVVRGAGAGPPVVLMHGNGSMLDELEASGLVDRLAQRHRVIMFDRPGFGYSERRRSGAWTAAAQAAAIAEALSRLGIERAIVLGHSWGTLVALALALHHRPRVAGLVLVSGYYYRTFRPDALLLSAPAWPVIGQIASRTTAPLVARAAWRGLVRMAFGPPPTPHAFEELLPWRFLKPARLRTAARESGLLMREAGALSKRYREVDVPTAILAGDADRIVRVDHAQRLHAAIRGSTLDLLPGVGHMLHHAAPDRVRAAVDRVAGQAGSAAKAVSTPTAAAEFEPVPYAGA